MRFAVRVIAMPVVGCWVVAVCILLSGCASVHQSEDLIPRRLEMRRVALMVSTDFVQRNLLTRNEHIEEEVQRRTMWVRDGAESALRESLPGVEVVHVDCNPAVCGRSGDDLQLPEVHEQLIAIARQEQVDAIAVVKAEGFRKSTGMVFLEELGAASARAGTFIAGSGGNPGIYIPGNPMAKAGPPEGFRFLEVSLVDGPTGNALWSIRADAEVESADAMIATAFNRFPNPLLGREFFTACNLFFDGDGEATDANYLLTDDVERRVLPLGTRVVVVEADGNHVSFRPAGKETGKQATFKLWLEYGRVRMQGTTYFPLILRPENPEEQLASLPSEVSAAIHEGRLTYGMTREQAVMARGLPPFHQTKAIDAPEWVYYDGPDLVQRVTFTDDRITSIKAGPPP